MVNARHSKARPFVQQHLFSGLTTFAELEQRITDLPDEKSRGDAFEVFAEAYLATQRKHDAETVWPLASVPSEVLGSLQLATQDYGVDGVLKTRLEKFSAYQVKFRTGRPALTWRELSTFMGLADSPNIHSRILLTNCDELPAVLNDRQGFFCIRGSDLDRLEADDFKTIEAWLADSAYQAPKKTPQPHQAEALNKILPAFAEHDRVSAIMACGTGKTLVALWVTEKMQAARVLVLVPSLALLRQTLHEWLRETNLPNLAYLCVCSDPTVKEGLDSIVTKQSDLDFQVSTDSANVRSFLDASFDGTKVIFSTYQSARVVGAALKPDEAFDLAVFDEAHKTAGREGRNYCFALEDSNLPIRKRLFLTATPRHYNPHQKDREGEAKLVFSMERPEVYGPQAFRLTFAEAARRGIICGYKVIISVITSGMVTNELLKRGDVLVNGDAVRARQVANQIALRDAIEKYGVSKVFTFHKTINSAASFVADGNEGVRTHLPDFQTFHVNGTMPTARRERQMRDFRAVVRGVISNARCLTEGVDVPAVDMVAFLSPRRSRVDIVQATGRAMRRSPGKTTGYVLVPLYVEQAANETIEAAVSRSAFDEVWDVLNSLQEQDDVLAELIRHAGEQNGRGKGFDDSGFADRVEFIGLQIGLEALRAAVTTRCFESLYSSWDTFFGKLAAFKERFGHCNVPQNWEDHTLTSWLGRQRQTRKLLSRDQIVRLNGVGFIWDVQSLVWDEMFAKLKMFKERFGHCNVETGGEKYPALHGWVSNQRTRRKKGTLTDERIEQLDSLGFLWDWQTVKRDKTWMKWYRELENYTREHGNPHVPSAYRNTKLASWVWIQRQRRKGTYKLKGSLDSMTTEQASLLDELGFRWDARDEKWAENFEELKKFKTQYGHCEVGLIAGDNDKLLSWVSVQRSSQARGKLDDERQAQLDALGFSWASEMNDRKWNEMFDRLRQYQALNGNADVPSGWKEDPKLAVWVSHQRQRRKQEQLSDKKLKLLTSLGLTWKSRDVGTWEDRLAEVAAFKANHGHCDIPLNYSENPKLGRFVNNMRTQRNSGKLAANRIAKLDALGFAWGARSMAEVGAEGINAGWKMRFDELLRFEEANGHCKVPNEWPENLEIGHWVNHQRYSKKCGQLHPKREEMLNEIGFDWGLARDEVWHERYAQLVEFKNLNGHCDVPYNYSENRDLGTWTIRQRETRKKNKLTPEREALLNEIGFTWAIRNSHDASS